MSKVSLEQRRLELLRRQLYGQSKPIEKTGVGNITNMHERIIQNAAAANQSQILHPETNYLKQDLLKIFILSSAAFGVQILLYWSLRMNLIHLKF